MVASDNKSGRFGGDMGFGGKQPVPNARNIRRLMKKYPNDKVLQERLQEELDKYKGVGDG